MRLKKKKRTDKWWFKKCALKKKRKNIDREWTRTTERGETRNLSKTNNYLLDTDIKLEAKMDLIIIHNSFEISISLSPPSPADLPRSRPTNDSSSNCMTGHPSRPPQSKLAHAR